MSRLNDLQEAIANQNSKGGIPSDKWVTLLLTQIALSLATIADAPTIESERKTDNSCDGCAFIGCYGTDYPCATCVRMNKDYFTPTPKMEVDHDS